MFHVEHSTGQKQISAATDVVPRGTLQRTAHNGEERTLSAVAVPGACQSATFVDLVGSVGETGLVTSHFWLFSARK
jgi:hypothetical protein